MGKSTIFSDSQCNDTEEWIKQLCIIDSTTISLFSYPYKRGSACDVRFISAATNDLFMLAPSCYSKNEIVALDHSYINYAKFEELTERNVVYVAITVNVNLH